MGDEFLPDLGVPSRISVIALPLAVVLAGTTALVLLHEVGRRRRERARR